ncbi:MAG: Gfo/Idh/MocA family oxidoreductase [Armatimonadetes bacterium]|nr:Gfo/Idh/MocA family oxidoreductase [Armatimonadota bacterium]
MWNVVCIGLKGHQGVCLSEIAKRPDARLVAVYDDDPAALRGASRLPGASAETLITPNLDEVLARRDVNVAILAEDNASRGHNLIECARRGWHLCAEKPLTLDLAELARVRQAITEAKVSLTMLLTMRFEAPYRAMRQAIADGAVGQPLNLSGQKSYKRGDRPAWQQNPKTFGATIPYIGIHPIDLLHFTTGCRFRRVAALAHNAGLPGSGRIDESCAVLLETTDGAVASVRLDYLRPDKAPSHGDDRIRVAGSTGVIEVLDGKVNLITAKQAPTVLPTTPPPNLFGQFLDSLAGGPAHDISTDECFMLTEVVLRAQEAAVRGTWVDIP